jgi:thiol:disulfide interchange protein
VRRDGNELHAALEIQVEPKYHLYHDEKGQPDSVGIPTVITFSGEGVSWSKARFPTPKKLAQPGVGEGGRDTWIWGHEGTFVVYARGVAQGSMDPKSISADVNGLTCTDAGECVPYRQKVESSGEGPDSMFAGFPKDLEIASGSSASPISRASESDPSGVEWDKVTFRDYEPRSLNEGSAGDGASAAPPRGLLMWLVFAFIAGLVLNVMPCVLPVVSIKVLSFVQQAGESRSRVLALGLAFSAGILVVFEALASFTYFAKKGWGAQFQNESFKIVMIAVVFGFALSLFDVFELGVPSKVGELAAVRREGLGDAFFKGIMATLLATPCSGPFLGSTLAWALAQPVFVVFAVFTTVGLGMAAPYALLTGNPALLRFVPKPGAWMKTFKHLMGFLLLGTVIFLMISVEKSLLLYTVALLVFVALACWWWGNFATFDKTRGQKLAHFAVAAAIVALGARFSFVELRGWLTPDEFWKPFDPVALEKAHDARRNVFVDFTADWCLTCKTNEKVVYTNDEIKALLAKKGFLVMKADETGDSPRAQAIKRLREELGAYSIPFMAVFPADDWQHPRTIKDLVTRGQMRKLLDACPDA